LPYKQRKTIISELLREKEIYLYTERRRKEREKDTVVTPFIYFSVHI